MRTGAFKGVQQEQLPSGVRPLTLVGDDDKWIAGLRFEFVNELTWFNLHGKHVVNHVHPRRNLGLHGVKGRLFLHSVHLCKFIVSLNCVESRIRACCKSWQAFIKRRYFSLAFIVRPRYKVRRNPAEDQKMKIRKKLGWISHTSSIRLWEPSRLWEAWLCMVQMFVCDWKWLGATLGLQ